MHVLFVYFAHFLLSFVYSFTGKDHLRLSLQDPDAWKNITEIIQTNGYYAEEHYVETDDQYILCLIRMRTSKVLREGAKVVYLQHGLLDSAHTWVNNLRNQSLGFILAEAGYDVWLGNSRGNTYSRRHKNISSDDRSYWDFSWDEMAEYDLPASINYVLSNTKTKKLAYIGHSQGCQIALAQFSRNATFQSHINVFIALAPVAYLGNVESPIRIIAPLAQKMEYVLRLFNHGEFLPSSDLLTFLGKLLCTEGHAPIVCKNIIYLIAGYDAGNTNVTRLPVYIAHTPAGTSTKNMVHYCQSIMSNKFQRYDYGSLKNIWIYGQRHPPEFNLSKLGVPTAIFHGGRDWLAVEKDVNRLAFEINGTLIGTYFLKHYNHLDFVWGLDAGYVLYPSVLDILQRY